MRNAELREVLKRYRSDKNLISKFVLVSFLLCLTGLTSACGSLSTASSTSSSNTASNPFISLSPDNATVASQEQLQFTARISGSANTAVTWSTSAGTISGNGFFTAPKVTSNTPVTITATSVADPVVSGSRNGAGTAKSSDTNPDRSANGNVNKVGSGSSHASATVVVTAPSTVAIVTSALPAADASTPYTTSLAATGGITPYQWSLANGTLPSGIQLQSSSGIIAGMTALAGSYPITAKVTDASGHSSTAALNLTVSVNSTSGFDGPAELPRVYIQTAISNTPTPGSTITVNGGGDLQSALNSANCGDTIRLQAGATFTGTFTFPAKSCDDAHWIIVRTSADDSTLPAEGNRLTPCYAGVSSLPGRPVLHCASTKNVMARLVMPTSNSGPIVFATGANHYRLIGLEVTRSAGIGIVYGLASAGTGSTANNLIFDRVWLHGTAQDETKKGIELGGFSYVSIIDSFFTDLHCTSKTGACTDASAIGGGANNPVGPFKVVDNFLEASGENILFGGANSATTPADIQVSHNHFFKPMIWMQGQPGYVGAADGNPFIVKNLFELKNAQRVLLEGNIMENSWGGFSQNGYGIVVTPTNQGGECPICQITDVTIRYNTVSHVGAGLQIANVLSGNPAALDGERYSIHDITIDDIDAVKYAGSGKVAEIFTEVPAPTLQNVSMNHITAFTATGLFSVGGANSPRMTNFTFNNSIVFAGTYPIWSTGGTTNCANLDKPLTTMNACFSPYSFAKNAIIAASSYYPPILWPVGNFFPATVSAVQFVNYNNGNGGNYQLLSSSPYHNAGTDGKDLGADVSTIVSETAGVY